MLAYGLAGGGLVVKIGQHGSVAERLMAIALLLFAADLARMALVDIRNFNSVRDCLASERLSHQSANPSVDASQLLGFGRSLGVTIALELVGLVVSWGWVGLGTSIVMCSQIVFNLSVNVSMQPYAQPAVRPWPISERIDVLLADTVALGLAISWMVVGQLLGLAIALLAMVTVYLAIKYVPWKRASTD